MVDIFGCSEWTMASFWVPFCACTNWIWLSNTT